MEPFALILAAVLAQTTATPAIAAPPPPPPMRADANGDGTISRQEFMARATAEFARMDANRDGQVTREERRAAMPMRRGHDGMRHGGPDGRGDHGGPGGDRDGRRGPPPGGPMRDPMGDREMTRADFVARAGARFDRMDTNHDGKVDAAERRAVPRPGPRGEMPPPPATPAR